jgi:hypothetical protein
MNFLFVKAFVLFLFSFSFLTLNAQVNFLQVPFETLVERAQKENKGVFVFLSNNNNESWWMEHNVFNNKAIVTCTMKTLFVEYSMGKLITPI